MSIIASIPNHDNSPWYIKMENRAKFWNKYAIKKGFDIKGNYSAYIVDFVINGKINNNPIKIKGHRQLSNVSSGIIPKKGRFFEKLTINIISTRIQSKYYLYVKKKGLFAFLTGKSNKSVSIGKYEISYNSKEVLDLLKVSKILESDNLVRLSITKSGFKMKLFELPANDEKLNNLKRLWEQNYS
tara:strand:+ start:799 stop:1353 length:555 start_codon:yes stop_codon:yes gene_type:complete